MLVKASIYSRKSSSTLETKLLSFTQFSDDSSKLLIARDLPLSFDPNPYKAKQEIKLNNEAAAILSMQPNTRTEDQQKVTLAALSTSVEAFGEFPIKMQKSLVTTGWYERFEAKRVIIRQGHRADNFYFIISGSAFVTILETNNTTNDSYVRTVALLKKGNSFGELALMHGARRSATVTCKDDVELLAIGREDFVDIFMHVEKGVEPEHISYLRTIDLLNGWPKDLLPYSDPRICLFTYFRRDVVMCHDSNQSDWVYFVKSGTCRVLKSLFSTRPNIPGIKRETYLPAIKPTKSTQMAGHHISSNTLAGTLAPSSFRALNRKIPKYRSKTFPLNSTSQSSHNSKECLFPHLKPLLMTESQHKKMLDTILEKHLETSGKKRLIEPVHQIQKPADVDDEQERVFVEIQKLGPRANFGLENIVFAITGGSTSVSLVSDGAECILINKKFFIQHMDANLEKKLRTTIQPYPSEESLQEKLQSQENWQAYKTMVVNRYMKQRVYEDSMFY